MDLSIVPTSDLVVEIERRANAINARLPHGSIKRRLREISPRPTIGLTIPLSAVRSMPALLATGIINAPGCYIVRGPDGTCLYVGRSKRMIVRLRSHLIDQEDGNGRQWRLSGLTEWNLPRPFAPPGCTAEILYTQNHFDFERELIWRLLPTHNRKLLPR